MKRVLVCGGRDYHDQDALYVALDRLHAEHHFAVVIAGGARGADSLAAQWAEHRGIPTEVYMAEWERLGRKAGPIRNQRMLDEGKPDLVIAFPGGHGTAGMMALARKAGVRVIALAT
jgi:predicted Rossmann-fold nucleotide-binding protein